MLLYDEILINIGGLIMKRKKYLGKGLVIGTICLLMLVSVPIVLGEQYTYNDAKGFIVGRCNTVDHNGLWLLGFTYLHKRDVTIQLTDQDGEFLVVGIGSPKIGFHFNNVNMKVKLYNVQGFFFWGGKSLLFNSEPFWIIARIRIADQVQITY